MSAYTKWNLTINNPLDYGFTHDVILDKLKSLKNLTYFCFSDEISYSGTPHTHIFLYKKRCAIDFNTVKNLFPQAHIEHALGSCQQNKDYLLKQGTEKNEEKADTKVEGTFYEFGECPADDGQGKRNDIHEMYADISSGASDFDLIEKNPSLIRYMNKFESVRQVLREKEFASKFRDMYVAYWYGPPGCGKTSGVLKLHGLDKVYIVDDLYHPWDNYSGQDVVLFDDYQNTYNINNLLRWLDIYPLKLSCRYTNKQACFTKIYFTSNKSFDDLFHSIKRDEPSIYSALERRFHCFRKFNSDGTYKDFQSMDKLKTSWLEPDQGELPFD